MLWGVFDVFSAGDRDRDVFAGELRPSRPPGRLRTSPPLVWQALRTGAIAGAVSAAAVFSIYFILNHAMPMPWIRIASLVALYGPVVGVLLACSVQLFVLGFDRIARLARPLVLVFNPVTAGGLAGACAGVAPGAVGVIVFGSYHGPFVGTGLIACGVIAGAVIVAVPLARRARRIRARGADQLGVIAAAAVIATLILVAVAAVVAPILVNGAFDEVRGALDTHGAAVGGLVGAIGGAVIGLYIGMVIALARSLRLSRRYGAASSS